MNERKRKGIIIGVLCCMVIFMGIGYAALSQVLTINGTSVASGSWNIKITNITVKDKTATATSVSAAPNNTDATSATFAVELLQPGDFIEYYVTIQNKGTIDAVLDSAVFSTTKNDYIEFSVDPSGSDLRYSTLTASSPNNVKVLTVRAEFIDNGSMPSQSQSQLTSVLTLNFVQASVANQKNEEKFTKLNDGTFTTDDVESPYPITGILSDGTAYELTSDGKLIFSGGTTFSDGKVSDSIRKDVSRNYDYYDIGYGELSYVFEAMLNGDMTAQDLIEGMSGDEEEEEEEEGETPLNFVSEILFILGLTKIDTIEFTDDFTNIEFTGNDGLEEYNPEKIIVSSSATVTDSNNVLTNNSITLERRSS